MAFELLIAEIELILRLLAGMIAGIAIGYERTLKGKSAGLRTFGLVGLGTATAGALFNSADEADAASRVVQGVLTGIGFLGAGVITLKHHKDSPKGLTTAAAVFVTAAAGCAAGIGHWKLVLTVTVCAIVLLLLDEQVERRVRRSADGQGVVSPRSKTGIESGTSSD